LGVILRRRFSNLPFGGLASLTLLAVAGGESHEPLLEAAQSHPELVSRPNSSSFAAAATGVRVALLPQLFDDVVAPGDRSAKSRKEMRVSGDYTLLMVDPMSPLAFE